MCFALISDALSKYYFYLLEYLRVNSRSILAIILPRSHLCKANHYWVTSNFD